MEPRKSAFPVALKYAIITSLASFILSLIFYLTNLYTNQAASWLVYIILLVGLIFTIRERRNKDFGGFISFGQAFGAGFLFCILTAAFSAVLSYIMLNFIAPDMVGEILKVTEQRMLDKGMTDEQVDMAMEMTRKFMTPVMMIVWVIVWTAIFGAIASLIAAAIMKKENPQLQQP